MRAMVLKEPGPVERDRLALTDLAEPEPGPGEVRIRVAACGVCHTDLHTVEGELALPRLPIVPGHQVVGVVEQVGPEVSGLRRGDRVGVPWVHSTCGACSFCRRGLENLCEAIRFTGLHVHGGYAEALIAPAGFVYPIPKGFGDTEAAPLLCAGIIGYRALRLSEIQPGEHLGLYGFGASAHVTIQVARRWGCQVYVFSRSAEHRRHAEALGAVWSGRAEETPPALLDASICFAPAGALVPRALELLRKGGTLALAGIHMSPIPQMPYALLYGERTLRSVANATRQDAREFLALAAEIPIRTEVARFPLEEANRVLRDLKASRLRGAAVLQVA
ncbi:MAG: zinc-dependent alcohol dehydrogenase family protein [Candidatus Methylomirabilales bacterium]